MTPDPPPAPRRLNPDFSARKGRTRSGVERLQPRPSLWEDPAPARPERAGSSEPAAAERRAVAAQPERRAPRTRLALEARARRNRLAVRLTIAAGVWSLGLLIGALVLPVYNGETISNQAGTTFVSETFVAGNGAWVLIPITVPLVVCFVVAVGLRGKRTGTDPRSGTVAWAAIGVLGVFALFWILSIGAFIIPVAILLAAGTALTTAGAPERRATRPAGTPAREAG